MDRWYEIAFDRLYPILYPHRGDEEARRAAASFAPRLLRGTRESDSERVLDLACGSGRHMQAFAGEGLDVLGVDLSGFLLPRAAERGLGGRLVQGDMRALPFSDGVFGGVVNMFTSFGYFDDDAENRRVLHEVARVLAPRGAFVVDFINSALVRSTPMERTRRTREGYTIDEDRALSGDGLRVVKHVTVTGRDGNVVVEYDERVRLFDVSELEAMLSQAGFHTEDVYGDYGAAAFDAGCSPRAIVVCTRSDATTGGR